METLLSPTKLFIRAAHAYTEKGAGLCRYDSANLLTHPEDEVALLLKFSTTWYIEIKDNIYQCSLLS